MRRLYRWGAVLTAAGLALGLLVTPLEGAAGPIRMYLLDPSESGDPDQPGGPGREGAYHPSDTTQLMVPILCLPGRIWVVQLQLRLSLTTKWSRTR